MIDKQRSIFDQKSDDLLAQKTNDSFFIFIDGASRGNPGESAAGVYIKKGEDVLVKSGFFLGKKTNNEAEYLALLLALFFIKKYAASNDSITIYSDSLLIIQQMKGIFKVKKYEMRLLHSMAVQESLGLSVHYEHVMREYNTVADLLANEGVDKKIPLPLKFLDILQKYEIFI